MMPIVNCLKHVENLGYTTVYNLCNDTQKIIPWGFGNWFGLSLIILFLIFLFYRIYSILKTING